MDNKDFSYCCQICKEVKTKLRDGAIYIKIKRIMTNQTNFMCNKCSRKVNDFLNVE